MYSGKKMNKWINICPTALDMAGQAYQSLGEQKTATPPYPSPAPQGQGGWVPLDGQVCGEEVGEKGKQSALWGEAGLKMRWE